MPQIQINDQLFNTESSSQKYLIDVLRNDLGLTGTKRGCSSGVCGVCTVLLNGRPVSSCRITLSSLNPNDFVQTIEGLLNDDLFRLLQATFLREGAVQCGYCTPGMLISAYSLLKKNSKPSCVQIRNALNRHLCRCTGYAPIERAILSAAEKLSETSKTKTIKRTIPDYPPLPVGGIDKVSGRAKYAADFDMSGLLHGAVLISPVPSGVVKKIDFDEALAADGVKYVLTAQDVPGLNALGRWRSDRPLLVEDKIRFIGDILALVLAESETGARQAVKRINVDIKKTKGVFDAVLARRNKKPFLHPEGNIAFEQHIRKGDPNTLQSNLRMFTSTFETGFIEHALLETEAAVAFWDGEVLTVIGPSQNVFLDRMEIMRILGLTKKEIHRVRVIQSVTGAAFGKREDIIAQPLAALGAWVSGRPVKIVLNREESFKTTTKRHPMRFTITSGIDGRQVRYRSAEILADTGAYSSWAPNILRKAAVHVMGPYRIPVVRVNAVSVYTNNAFSGAMRGFGATQAILAVECHVDSIARELNLDPLTFRLENALRDGDCTATGQRLNTSGVMPVLKAAAETFGWKGPARGRLFDGKEYIGYGIASAFYGIGYGNAIPDKGQVDIRLYPDGILEIRTGAIDYGQGASSVFAKIAGETLGIPYKYIQLIQGDTAETPDSGSTVASRQTFVTGSAVLKACLKIRKNLNEQLIKTGTGIYFNKEMWVHGEQKISWEELIKILQLGEILSVRARTLNPSDQLDENGQGDVYQTYSFAAACCEVRIDVLSGNVRLKRVVSAHESGRIIHPVLAEGQVTGGVIMAAGMALKEEYKIKEGVPLQKDFDDYQIFRFNEVPDIKIVFIEPRKMKDGWTSKGLGEPAMLAATPAIVNAVADALNKSFYKVPITPSAVLQKLLDKDDH